MKFKLVDNWQNAWRWFSMNAMLIAASIQGTWLQVPEDMKSQIPSNIVNYLTLSLLVFGIIGRLVKQEGKSDDKQSQSTGTPPNC